ncbi:hypothetical protein D9756_001825 [Leucocoprinus leucothites]|uniref:Uncharacterized protein n=1 Tax=Leucocoprinus leucothites TaxID=201217 RepID=A0A8H5G3W8_9AGAR|nr:hypothetical protein D9756_001825 [Leucoagaricus leucothites]
MGSSASKAARKLPKRAEPPAWVGKRTPGPSDPKPAGVTREQVQEQLASEHKSEAIEQDARDPHLLANLQQLGPVKVDHHMKTIRPEAASNTAQLFQARQQQEQNLETAQQNPGRTASSSQFYAAQLASVLNARKSATDRGAVESVTRDLGIDLAKVESIVRFVNTPSVSKGGVKTVVDKDGNEQTIAKAVWIDAPYADLSKTSSTQSSSSVSK